MGRPAFKPEGVWRFIEKRSEDECWPWKGCYSKPNGNGYAIYPIKHEQYRVSRILCWLRDPEVIPLRAPKNSSDRLIVLHSCDNPSCCNPKHLSVGKPKQNTQDMIAKGRRAYLKGEKGGRAKLANADVERIRESYLFGALQRDLADIYGVSGSTISTAINKKYYGVVP